MLGALVASHLLWNQYFYSLERVAWHKHTSLMDPFESCDENEVLWVWYLTPWIESN